jgi:hypothetical protein
MTRSGTVSAPGIAAPLAAAVSLTALPSALVTPLMKSYSQ